jgi:HEAT repeat protein
MALGKIGDQKATQALFETTTNDQNNDVRLAACKALMKIQSM